MVVPAGVFPMPTQADVTLIKGVARAFRWRRMLETGRYETVKELAQAERINASYVCRTLRLTLLAPDIVEAILDGRLTEVMTLPGLMKGAAVEWERQREVLGATCSCGAQEDVEYRPRGGISCVYRPTHAVHKASTDREAKSGTFVGTLGRQEGLKNGTVQNSVCWPFTEAEGDDAWHDAKPR